MTNSGCPLCGGHGYLVEEIEGRLVARPCQCRVTERAGERMAASGIPERYRFKYVFERYRPEPGTGQDEALTIARGYAESFPAVPEEKNGLLFIGPCGVGKTHLAVAILMEVVMRKGLPALFVDLNDLYREIRNTYNNRETDTTEYDIMAPLVEAPLLLIDELGCLNSPWAQDTLHYLISQRYNRLKPTLCTSNFPDGPGSGVSTLEERIGTPTRSRLYEMCRVVAMDGKDRRRG
ncbi:MAG: ATP-binding protein [Acidobacteriota bacterium]